MGRIKESGSFDDSIGLKWQAVKKFVLSEVAMGKYTQGDVLPSESYLCQHVGVSRNTIRQAFDELEKEGYINRVQGKGTFLAKFHSGKAAQKTQMFALIIPDIVRTLYPSLVQGFDHEQSIRSYQTVICQTYNDVNKQGNIILQLLNRGIDGLAIVPPTMLSTPVFQIEQLINANIPVVACHRSIAGINIPTLTWDREGVGKLAGKILLEQGHRRIAYFGVSKYSVTEAHVKGLKAVLNDAGISLQENLIIYEPASDTEELENKKISMFIDLLGTKERPTAVFCNDDTEAERVYWIANKIGMKVPQDLSIIGFGNNHRDTIFRKNLTSVVVDEYSLGKKAALILHETRAGKLLMHNDQTFMIDLNIHVGTTVSRPNC
ncbi:MAG: hypothetical protein A2Y10_19890 [Planctomycetes bacterium GWF2_41_51]|nr:MAG: hypothetical protein A2Y10_19890 [Planctomycetes bacterium GWF2_41_51]HBG28547.1 hypothetical protein [Phycisphaerales bacterium]